MLGIQQAMNRHCCRNKFLNECLESVCRDVHLSTTIFLRQCLHCASQQYFALFYYYIKSKFLLPCTKISTRLVILLCGLEFSVEVLRSRLSPFPWQTFRSLKTVIFPLRFLSESTLLHIIILHIIAYDSVIYNEIIIQLTVMQNQIIRHQILLRSAQPRSLACTVLSRVSAPIRI